MMINGLRSTFLSPKAGNFAFDLRCNPAFTVSTTHRSESNPTAGECKLTLLRSVKLNLPA
jgi:hypothetical protein